MKIDAKQLRKDLSLSDKEFEAKYPGIDKEVTKLSDEELEKVAGGGRLTQAGDAPLETFGLR